MAPDPTHYTQAERAIGTLHEAEHWIKAMYGGEFTELRMKRTNDGVLLMCKATYQKRNIIAFVSGDSFSQALVSFGYLLATKGLRWRDDLWPPNGGP